VLIAEISNTHFGSIKKAKELIRAAHESGADLIKAQAFRAKDIKSGSMPVSFYEECAMQLTEYLELIEYARSIGNDLFYSIFSNGFQTLSMKQNWHKIAGSQTREGKADEHSDVDNMIISIPGDVDLKTLHKFEKAEVLYVSPYQAKDPHLVHIDRISRWLGRSVGYSDHTVGIDWCVKAIELYNVNIIEKHFCLNNYETYGQHTYRDTIFGVRPKQFEKLALAFAGGINE
jgi:sialic acid synthase SpsE